MRHAFLVQLLSLLLLVWSKEQQQPLANATAADVGNLVLYTDIQLANTTDSLERIRRVPLKYFEFKYDSVEGRKQMGVLPGDAQRFFPESVDIVESYSFPSKDRTKPAITLSNFPVVDKNAIYMHGLAAMQDLIRIYDSLSAEMGKLQSNGKMRRKAINEMKERLDAEASEQALELKKIAEAELEAGEKKKEIEQKRAEEEREIMLEGLEDEKKLLAFQEEMTKKRMEHEEALAQANLLAALEVEQKLGEQRELLRKEAAEALHDKRMALEKELEIKRSGLEMEKIKAEVDAKAEQERANEDVVIRKMQAKAKLDTDRLIEGIKTVSQQVTRMVNELISRPKQVAAIIAVLLALLAVYYAMRELITVVREFIQAQIGKPSLVRETSYHWSLLPMFITNMWAESLAQGLRNIKDHFKNVVLSSDDKERICQLALATRNTKRSGAPYRHVLLHGPPGTGKTLIARRLAECSGMDYAIMSGGDVGPLGEDAVSQLHKLFRWASRSRKGLLVFIDEAEAFLGSRGASTSAAEDGAHLRHALNALLYQTGTQSRSFMLVLATNRPEDLDSAVLDRIDVSIKIGLPGPDQCLELVRLYMKEHVVLPAKESERGWSIFRTSLKCDVHQACTTDETLNLIAGKVKNFSGREIAKLFIAMQYAMYLAERQTLTMPLLESTLTTKLKEHYQKTGFDEHEGPSSAGDAKPNKEIKELSFEQSGRERRQRIQAATIKPASSLLAPQSK